MPVALYSSSKDLEVVGDTVEQLMCTNLFLLDEFESNCFVTDVKTSSLGNIEIIESQDWAISDISAALTLSLVIDLTVK